MSRIEELFKQHCPDGVEYSPLGEVGDFIRGRRFTKNDYVESGLGCIHYGQIYTDYDTAANSTVTFLNPDLRNSLRLACKNDLVIAATGENIEDVCKAVAWLGEEEVAVHDDCYIYRHSFDPMFASFLFQSSTFQEQKARYVSESKVVRVSGTNLSKIRVPVPPLEVQREIVKVLTLMASLKSELEAELRAELEARQRQYVHYRDVLLTFPETEKSKQLT
ncbi:restriction endonuclease subunit S [Streptomyces sp. G5(2025)]|uniref:restriction endonuclease subunit S n=1 Tax=Streptomyces sp. G5(2025) TaxID=3406628 RepID=UPI003C23A152